MIKINLLPQEKPKSYRVYYQIIAASALLIITVVAVGVMSFVLNKEISDKENDKRQKEKTVRELQVIIDQVLQYERDSNTLKAKLGTIETLQKNQRGPVILLEEVSKSLPEQVWLTLMQNKKEKVSIRGYGLNWTSIGDFMTALENSPVFFDVKLSTASLRPAGDRDIHEFELLFSSSVIG